ncbi:MAG TPA: DUF4124 domain-containing protein [Steroidobacter sp.]|jgi:hypothetical protein|nr:DUF4124 domain-containing protein [Steroidobacter sp.]
MLRSLIILSLVASATASQAVADVYKFKDEQGNILYTDKPTTLPAERLNVQSQKTDVVAVQSRQEAELKRLQENSRTHNESANQRSERQNAEQLTAKDKAERCVKARERYDSYMASQRLYEEQPNGERRFLSSEEIDGARASAKSAMDAMCQ